MSPPVAVELFQSPPTVTEQNPNHTFTNFKNFSQNQSAATGFSAPPQPGPHPVRTKPRLVKVRKSQQSRGGNKEREVGNDFNPFKSVSGQVNGDACSNNAFVFGSINIETEVKIGEIKDNKNKVVDFFFGTNKSECEVKAKRISEVGAEFGDKSEKVEKRVSDEKAVNADDSSTNASFVFASSWFNSGSGSNSEYKEKFADNGSWKQDYGNTVFMFGSGSKKSSSSRESMATKCPDETHSNVYVNGKYEVGSNVASTTAVYKLPDEMNKLNINDSGCVNGPSATNDSCKDNHGNAENIFVFGGSEKSSNCTPETTFRDRMSAGQANGNTSNENHIVFSNTCAKVNDFVEASTPERFIFHAGCKEEISLKGRGIRGKGSKKVGRNLKQNTLCKQGSDQEDARKESNCEENPLSPGSCSPMDFSPCQETTVTNQFSAQSPCHEPAATYSTVASESKNENQPNWESQSCNGESCFTGEFPSRGFVSGDKSVCSNFQPEEVCNTSVSGVPLTEDGRRSNSEKQESTCRVQFGFDLGLGNENQFTFSSSVSEQGKFSSIKRQHRRKNRMKVGNDTFVITPSSNVAVSSSSAKFPPSAGTATTSLSERSNKSEAGEQLKQGVTSSDTAFQEVCEKWRLRGNQAYKNDNLPQAEHCYTQGISSVPSDDASGSWVKPLVFCYSNRAATRISLGRIREALGDCTAAAALDSSFLKVYVRAANCHLMLGEVENTMRYFNKCLESGGVVCLDRRIVIEAAEGLRKAEKVVDCINRSAKLLDQKTSDSAVSALEIIAEALSTSSCSEKLLEMKAEALCMLQKYDKAIQLCEQTLDFAERNFNSSGTDNNQPANIKGSGRESFSIARLWRWHLMSKSYFYMGKLDTALDLLKKLEQTGPMQEKCGQEILDSSKSLASTIHELLSQKNAGNEAVQSGKYTEAVEHYTVAVSSNVESRPFAAICFCNRAAAHQALGQIADAIADCSLAMALDKSYKKAISRRAALHEMIRDYDQSSNDLRRLISILKSQSDEKSKLSSTGRTPVTKELKQSQRHLSSMEEEAKKGIPLDLYLILGIKQSDTAAEIKKAYRKAALRHHPDKVLARSECGDAGRLCKEISEELHKDADRLFKMIGEAYAVLSDTTKRSEYDLEEESRKAPKESSNGRSPHRRSSDDYSYSFGRNNSRRYWEESWKTHGNGYSRW